MAREADRTVVSTTTRDGRTYATLACPFTDKKEEKSVNVDVPVRESWLEHLLSLSKEDQDSEYDRWVTAIVTAAKAKEREVITTMVKRGGEDINVLSMRSDNGMDDPENIKVACAVINASYMEANAFGWDGVTVGKGTPAPQVAYINARRILVEAGKARFVGEGKEHEKMILPA